MQPVAHHPMLPASYTWQQIRIDEQIGESSSLHFSVDGRADVNVSSHARNLCLYWIESDLKFISQCSQLTVTAIRDALVLLIIQP